MKVLNNQEIKEVSGAVRNYGTGPTGIFGETNIGQAARFTKGLGYVGLAFSVGWAIGSYINEHTNIQSWLADKIDNF